MKKLKKRTPPAAKVAKAKSIRITFEGDEAAMRRLIDHVLAGWESATFSRDQRLQESLPKMFAEMLPALQGRHTEPMSKKPLPRPLSMVRDPPAAKPDDNLVVDAPPNLVTDSMPEGDAS